jgi:cellobiose-specific phosphotransferase system component IIC
MGITIGDALTVIATITAICLSSWALILCVAYLFSSKALKSQQEIEQHPARSAAVGALIILTLGSASGVLMRIPLPIAKMIGAMGYFALIIIAAIGAAGLASLLAERMMKRDARISLTNAAGKAAALLIIACVMPFFGWFILAPVITTVCAGAGAYAVLSRVPKHAMQQDAGGA